MKNKSEGRSIRELKRSVKELSLDLQDIIKEHDLYRLNKSKEELMKWFDSLPIDTLYDSIAKERQLPRRRYSLFDMKHKYDLRKLYEQKKEELELEERELRVAQINHIMVKIKRIEDGKCSSRSSKRKSTSKKQSRK